MVNIKKMGESFEVLPEAMRTAKVCCGLVLGSGWSTVLDGMEVVAECPYTEIPVLGGVGVEGHAGRLVLARVPSLTPNPSPLTPCILAFCGRRHWYEGVEWEAIVFPIEVFRRLKVPNVLVTNASGGINRTYMPGDIALITDHIRMASPNPLQGRHLPEYGPRFPDQSTVYNPEFSQLIREAAVGSGLILKEGIYAFSGGPVFETPAEVRAYGALGADMVGMSTVPETMMASAAGLRVAALSLISNHAAGIGNQALTHAEVIEAATAASPRMAKLLTAIFKRIA